MTVDWTREDCIRYLGWERAEHIITDDIRLLHRCVSERMDLDSPKRQVSPVSAQSEEQGDERECMPMFQDCNGEDVF